MTRSRLLILGAGGYGCAVAEAVQSQPGAVLVGFADDRWPGIGEVQGHPVLGKLSDLEGLRKWADAVVVAIGHNETRRVVFLRAQEAGFHLISVVHPRAIVSSTAVIGRGVTVMAGVVVGHKAKLGDGCVISAGAIVDHDAQVGEFAQLSAGACMAGGSLLGAQAWLQEGCVLRPGQVVAGNTIVSTGGQQGG